MDEGPGYQNPEADPKSPRPAKTQGLKNEETHNRANNRVPGCDPRETKAQIYPGILYCGSEACETRSCQISASPPLQLLWVLFGTSIELPSLFWCPPGSCVRVFLRKVSNPSKSPCSSSGAAPTCCCCCCCCCGKSLSSCQSVFYAFG
jgi:hypothetical protein